MQTSRRVARELALKVLFQVDIGKQPLTEVLEGACDQIRTQLESGVNQVVHDTQAGLRRLAIERAGPLPYELSARSSRQIKAVATSMATEIRALAMRSSELSSDLCGAPAEGGAARAMARLHEAGNTTRANIQRHSARESAYPKVLTALGDFAARNCGLMEAVFDKQAPTIEATSAFMHRLVLGATEQHDEIDRRVAALSTGWALDRQAAVDRNIMRLAAYEILFDPDIPAGASINEAVELAKKYSTAESGRFVTVSTYISTTRGSFPLRKVRQLK